MYSYDALKRKAVPISQTVDEPIKFLDFWDLWDLGLAMLVIFIFGIISYAWWTMTLGLILSLLVIPPIKRKNNRGYFLHWFYKNFKITLPSLFNPMGKRKYSD